MVDFHPNKAMETNSETGIEKWLQHFMDKICTGLYVNVTSMCNIIALGVPQIVTNSATTPKYHQQRKYD